MVITILGTVLALYLALLLVAAFWSVKPPRLPVALVPEQFEEEAQSLTFSSRGFALAGWFVSAESPKAVCVLAHGYLMSRMEVLPLALWLKRRGVSCLLFDFPGHGQSPAATCSVGVAEWADVAASCREARSLAPGLPLILFGSSMGAAAALMALAREKDLADAAIFDACYGRLSRALFQWFYFLGGRPLQWLLWPSAFMGCAFIRLNPFRVDMAIEAQRLPAIPKLFLHGKRDTLAEPHEVIRVIEAAQPCEVAWLPGGHCNYRWIYPQQYYEAIEGFLSRFLLERTQDDTPIARISGIQPSSIE